MYTRRQWIQSGFFHGAFAGVQAAFLWAFLSLAILALAAMGDFLRAEVESVARGVSPQIVRDPAGIMVFVLQSGAGGFIYLTAAAGFLVPITAALGGAVGALLGWLLSRRHIAPYRANRLALGAGVGALVLGGAHHPQLPALLQLSTPLDTLLALTLPALLFLFVCTHLTVRLPTLIGADGARRGEAQSHRRAEVESVRGKQLEEIAKIE